MTGEGGGRGKASGSQRWHGRRGDGDLRVSPFRSRCPGRRFQVAQGGRNGARAGEPQAATPIRRAGCPSCGRGRSSLTSVLCPS